MNHFTEHGFIINSIMLNRQICKYINTTLQNKLINNRIIEMD